MAIDFEKDFDIKNLTKFKTGGKIAKVFFPKNVDEFIQILQKNPDIKVFGNLSNTLVSDFGYNGSIILTSKMDKFTIDGTKAVADCGVKGPKLALAVSEKGLSGFEFMIGFPGTVGGEVCMNASAHFQSISDKLVSVLCYSADKGLVRYSKSEMNFAYRTSRCQSEDLIVLQAEFELDKKNPSDTDRIMKKNLILRKNHQPSLTIPNCGSIFKNPENESAGRLLESAGAKNLSSGGAKIWQNHANFIVNSGNGTSSDILNLMYEMQKKVKEMYNIKLEPEIKFLGGNNERENEIWQILSKK